MKAYLLIALILSTSVLSVENWGLTEEEDVVVGKTAEFDAFIAEHPFVLAEFYAPWCGHCKTLAPEYAKAAKALKTTDPAVPLVKIDATAETDLASRFGVQGYPTLKWFVNGKAMEYGGGRTEPEIIQWITKKTGPASRLIPDAADLEEQKGTNKVVVVFYGSDNDQFKNYQSAAQELDSVSFQHVFDPALVEATGNRVVLFKQFDEGRQDLESAFTKDELLNWIEAHRHETVMSFEGDQAIDRVFGKEAAAIFLFTDESTGAAHDQFKGAAEANKNAIVWSHSTITTGLGQRLAEYVGVKTEDAPCVRIVHPKAGDLAKFPYDGEMTTEGISKFVKDWENGLLARTYKSQDVPLTNDEPVKIVVGKNFEQIVLNDEQDVLMEYYAPWCGHCKSLAPKYDALAAKVAHMKNLVIAKMDSTENEVEGVAIKGFPTIKFYKKGQKQNPMDFDGDRTEEGMIKFLKENVSFPWTDSAETDL